MIYLLGMVLVHCYFEKITIRSHQITIKSINNQKSWPNSSRMVLFHSSQRLFHRAAAQSLEMKRPRSGPVPSGRRCTRLVAATSLAFGEWLHREEGKPVSGEPSHSNYSSSWAVWIPKARSYQIMFIKVFSCGQMDLKFRRNPRMAANGKEPRLWERIFTTILWPSKFGYQHLAAAQCQFLAVRLSCWMWTYISIMMTASGKSGLAWSNSRHQILTLVHPASSCQTMRITYCPS